MFNYRRHSERPWVFDPPIETKVGVILTLSGAKGKDLQFLPEANSCRFFASLRMTASPFLWQLASGRAHKVD
jgi:hypothetical protein